MFNFGRLEGNVRRILIPGAWLSRMLALAAQAIAVDFPDGVASGDVTSTRAILWTRSDTNTNIKVEVFNNAALHPPKVFQGKIEDDRGPKRHGQDRRVRPDAEHPVLVPVQEGRGHKRRRDLQDGARPEHAGERQVRIHRRLGRDQGERCPLVQQLRGAAAGAGRERRLLRPERRHDLLGLELPHEPGDDVAGLPGGPQRGTGLPEHEEPARVHVDVRDDG